MSRETEAIIAAISAAGVEHAVTDINTVGVHTPTGNHYKKDCQPAEPFHAMDTERGRIGRAVDFAHRRGDGERDTKELLAIYEFFDATYGQKGLLNELYYSGPGADHCVRSGKRMLWTDMSEGARKAIRNTHHDHVHVAVASGVFLNPEGRTLLLEEDDDDMPKPDSRVAACIAPNGGVWTLTFDGGVRATQGAPFFGSYPGLPPEKRKGKRNFIAIVAEGEGYTLISDDDDASKYHFDAKVFADMQKRLG